jgi:hypothetical protein
VDITVYLPDDIGAEAKKREFNLSGLLRGAVQDEINGQDERKRLLAEFTGKEIHTLEVDDDTGTYTVRLHAKFLGQRADEKVSVYFAEDERIYVYEDERNRLHRDVTRDDLADWFDGDTDGYVAVMNALGDDAVIDIGQR